LKCFDLKKCAQHEKKCSHLFFLEVIFFGVFFGMFGEIWANILRTPKNLPAPTPVRECLETSHFSRNGRAAFTELILEPSPEILQ